MWNACITFQASKFGLNQRDEKLTQRAVQCLCLVLLKSFR